MTDLDSPPQAPVLWAVRLCGNRTQAIDSYHEVLAQTAFEAWQKSELKRYPFSEVQVELA